MTVNPATLLTIYNRSINLLALYQPLSQGLSSYRPLERATSGGARRNRPRSIYQYSSMAPRLSGKNCKFFNFLLSSNSQKRLRYKENNTKYRSLTRKPRSHVRILIYRTWPIDFSKTKPVSRILRSNERVQYSNNQFIIAFLKRLAGSSFKVLSLYRVHEYQKACVYIRISLKKGQRFSISCFLLQREDQL